MLEIRFILVFMSWIVFIECEMEPLAIGGSYADIKDFPHSVFMSVACNISHDTVLYWICGASVVNELIALTAAHCIFECSYRTVITVFVGNVHIGRGFSTTVRTYLVHKRFTTGKMSNDIALMKLKRVLKFGKNVRRVAFMKNPPYHSKAKVASWGITNEHTLTMDMLLKYIDQNVWDTADCRQVIKSAPKGSICARSDHSGSYSSSGDSGSALVVRGYIQIGIVSYKMPSISRSLVVYTDTGYFYDWIRKNSKKLYCVKEE